MGFAGLYETWSDATGGEIDTACIVTTAANRLVGRRARPHAGDPRPASSLPGSTSTGVEAAKALALLKPAPEAALELVEIGRRSIVSPTTTSACRGRSRRRSARRGESLI